MKTNKRDLPERNQPIDMEKKRRSKINADKRASILSEEQQEQEKEKEIQGRAPKQTMREREREREREEGP